MIIQPTIRIPIPLHDATGQTAPIKLLRWGQRATQVVGEGFGFHVVVVVDIGVVDRGAGAVDAGLGGYGEVGGLVGEGFGGVLGAGVVC